MWLLDHDADITAIDYNGKTAIDLAAEIGIQDLVGLLADHIAWKSQEDGAGPDYMRKGGRKFQSRFLEAEDWAAQLDDYSKGGKNWEVWSKWGE